MRRWGWEELYAVGSWTKNSRALLLIVRRRGVVVLAEVMSFGVVLHPEEGFRERAGVERERAERRRKESVCGAMNARVVRGGFCYCVESDNAHMFGG